MVSECNRPTLDVNSARALFATVYLGVIGASVFIVQPGFVQGLVQFYRYSEQQAGYTASAEIWGLALTTVVLAAGGHNWSWRLILKLSIALFGVGNLASLMTTDATVFSSLRFIAGLGSGGLVSLTFTIMGLTRLPDRNFGYMIMGVLTYGALGLWVMPQAFDVIGMQGVIVFFALFALSGWPLINRLPDSGEEHLQVEEDAICLPQVFRVLAIIAMFTYFLAQGVIWAYLFLIGLNGGVSEQGVANGLMLSQFFGIAGAFVPTLLGHRYGRILPLSVGIIGGSLVLYALYGTFTATTYAVTVCAYNFAWNMTHPFLLGAMASFDQYGRVVVYAIAAQMLGLAMGPAFAASLLNGGHYASVIRAGIAIFVLSWLFIMAPLLKHRQTLNTEPG